MSIYNTAQQLAAEIRSSEEYRGFLEAKDQVQLDQGNYNMIKNFQIKQLEIQRNQLMQEDIPPDMQQELEQLYSLLSLNPTTRAYLEAEFRISKLLNDVQVIIGEVVQDVLPVGLEELD